MIVRLRVTWVEGYLIMISRVSRLLVALSVLIGF